MARDAVVEETRRIRDRLAKAHGYDVRKIARALQQGRGQERAEVGDAACEEAAAKAYEGRLSAPPELLCRVGDLRRAFPGTGLTPMEAKLTDHAWTIQELLAA